MTDREILDQLDQWLDDQHERFDYYGWDYCIDLSLDKLRELRALADDPGLADWLTQRATSTSPSRPVNEFLDELETDQ